MSKNFYAKLSNVSLVLFIIAINLLYTPTLGMKIKQDADSSTNTNTPSTSNNTNATADIKISTESAPSKTNSSPTKTSTTATTATPTSNTSTTSTPSKTSSTTTTSNASNTTVNSSSSKNKTGNATSNTANTNSTKTNSHKNNKKAKVDKEVKKFDKEAETFNNEAILYDITKFLERQKFMLQTELKKQLSDLYKLKDSGISEVIEFEVTKWKKSNDTYVPTCNQKANEKLNITNSTTTENDSTKPETLKEFEDYLIECVNNYNSNFKSVDQINSSIKEFENQLNKAVNKFENDESSKIDTIVDDVINEVLHADKEVDIALKDIEETDEKIKQGNKNKFKNLKGKKNYKSSQPASMQP